MNLLLWITIGFIATGFVVLISLKKSMENKLAYITANNEVEDSSEKAKSIIWWIVSVTVWGMVSIILVVWWFQTRFG